METGASLPSDTTIEQGILEGWQAEAASCRYLVQRLRLRLAVMETNWQQASRLQQCLDRLMQNKAMNYRPGNCAGWTYRVMKQVKK